MLIALMAWGFDLYRTTDHGTTSNYLYNIGYALVYLFGAGAAFSARTTLGSQGLVAKGFFYLALSFISYALGLVVWTYYNLFNNAEVPYPSLADIFFVFFIPFTALAIVRFLQVYQILISKRVVIESIIVFLISTVAIFWYQGSDTFFGDISTLEKAFNLMYLLTDSILITAAMVVIRSSGGKLQNNLVLLVIGYLVRALADMVFYYRAAQELYWNGDISDVLYAVSAFLMALAAVKLAREFARIDASSVSPVGI